MEYGLGLVELPNTIVDLVNLRHLQISYYTLLPSGIGKLTSLRTLRCYKVGSDNGGGIEELGPLKNLKGILEIQNLEMVKNKEEAKTANLLRKPNIFKLVLKWTASTEGDRSDEDVWDGLQSHASTQGGRNDEDLSDSLQSHSSTQGAGSDEDVSRGLQSHASIEGDEDVSNSFQSHASTEHGRNDEDVSVDLQSHASTQGGRFDEDVLDGLQPHPSLKCLEIHGYTGINFPLWTMRMEVGNPRNGLHNLVNLTLKDCTQCENIPMIGHLLCLKFLELNSLSNVQSIGLEFYGSGNCSTSSSFPALEELNLLRMPKLTEWVNAETATTAFPCLESLIIESCTVLKVFPSHFPRLKRLEIRYCNNLEKLPNDLNTLQSLERLKIENCSKLKSIPYARGQSQGLTTFRELRIVFCRELTGLPCELLDSTSSLNILELAGLNSLEDVEILIPCILRMSSLQKLVLRWIPKLMTFPLEVICCFRSLWYLEIGGFLESVNIVCYNDFLNGILPENQFLQSLSLNGKDDWESLPDQIQHLTALRNLWFVDFGIEALPEWLENLSSLRHLGIVNCKRLKHMPSVTAMQRLAKLEFLTIQGCPLMVDRCSPQESSPGAADNTEWHKISHIRNVSI